MNIVKLVINFIAKLLSKIKCKCHSDCCAIDCDSMSAEEYRDIMIAALMMANKNTGIRISHI